jgi:demethylmenaquinone methyltransferase/2-methoxy-6-polyprenyl-1,4-benzoquinol methylase
MGDRDHSGVLPAAEEKAAAVETMFDRIAGRYDLLNRLLTFGLDIGWRRRTVSSLDLPRRSVVLDVACGTGDLCRDLQHAGYKAIGVDFSAGMLAAARTNAPLVRGDALGLPVRDGAVDALTCGFALRNFTDLPPFFSECARVVRPGGRIAFLEVAVPTSPLLRGGHAFYFGRVVPFIGGLLSDRTAYRYLPESTRYLPSPGDLATRLAGAGFTAIRRELLGVGAAQLITAERA